MDRPGVREKIARDVLAPLAEKYPAVREGLAERRVYCDEFPDLPWCSAAPEDPQPDPAGPAAGEFERAWKIIPQPKVNNMVADPETGAIMLTASQVFHGGNKTTVWMNGREVRSFPFETLTLWTWNGRVYGTPEHGERMVKWNGREFIEVGPIPRGYNWSVAAWGPFVAFSKGYNGMFHSRPIFLHPETGEPSAPPMPANAMPRCMVRRGERLYVTANFGDRALGIYNVERERWEGVYETPALSIGFLGERLIGLGGNESGPAHLRKSDGKMYLWGGRDRWEPFFDTGCYAGTDCYGAGDGALMAVYTDEDRAFEVTEASERGVRLVCERGNDPTELRDRSWGGCGCRGKDGRRWLAWSDRGDWSEVLVEQGGAR